MAQSRLVSLPAEHILIADDGSLIAGENVETALQEIAGDIDTIESAVSALDVMTARGDMVYQNATVPARLEKGTSGNVLMIGANDPAWVAPGDLAISDTLGNFAPDTIQGAISALSPVLDDNLILPAASLPTTEATMWEGMRIYDTTNDRQLWCKVPGKQEVDTVSVTAGAVTKSGDITLTLNGVDVVVAVVGGTAAVYNATITAAASADGNVTVTLDGVDEVVAVVNGDSAIQVADKITAAYVGDADWTVGNVDAVLTFTALAKEVKSGDFDIDVAATGVTCTAGVTETTPGVDTDSAEDVADKIFASTFTGWTVEQDGAELTFTKAAVGVCSAPTAVDTAGTGVTFSAFARTNQGVATVWTYGEGSWQAWTPSLSWTTAPAEPVAVARYMAKDHTCFFNIVIDSTDGNGSTALTVPLPVEPKDNNAFVAVHGIQMVGAGFSMLGGYIDDGASDLAFYNFQQATDGSALKIIVSGFYEIA